MREKNNGTANDRHSFIMSSPHRYNDVSYIFAEKMRKTISYMCSEKHFLFWSSSIKLCSRGSYGVRSNEKQLIAKVDQLEQVIKAAIFYLENNSASNLEINTFLLKTLKRRSK